MAKTIAKMLNSTSIKKITGSDVLSKWVGEAERQVRELFQPAEEEWARKGIYR
jgi:vesicle-fusing ATPase